LPNISPSFSFLTVSPSFVAFPSTSPSAGSITFPTGIASDTVVVVVDDVVVVTLIALSPTIPDPFP